MRVQGSGFRVPERDADEMVATVRQFTAEHELLPVGCRVLVAVSGGQDSCALLDLLTRLREELCLQLSAAHLNHGFRGEEAAADAELARSLAAERCVPIVVEVQDVPAMARRLHLSAQQAARRARREFLERAAAQLGAGRIAVGHTHDDHIETVVLNILRGTGTDGLRGLRPLAGNIVRPILCLGRADTAQYCAEQGIAFREDASNRSLKYRRNRVREELLPTLRAYYNPAVNEALARLSEIAANEAELLDGMAREALEGALEHEEEDALRLSAGALHAMPMAIARRVLRLAIERVRGTVENLELRAVETALCGGAVNLAGGVHIRSQESSIVIARSPAPSSSIRAEYPLRLPGCTLTPRLGGRFVAENLAAPLPDPRAESSYTALFDAERLQQPLVARSWRPGDRIQQLGMAGSRKLQDVFTDAKVPAEQRTRLPVVCDACGPVWVPSIVFGERAKVAPETVRAVRLTWQASGGHGTKRAIMD